MGKIKLDEIWAKARMANSISKDLEKILTTKEMSPGIKKSVQECYRFASALSANLSELERVLRKNSK
jgi:predicted component of type VI protein secretion system